jgi:long-subunit fatty acid transport protein
MTSRSKIKLTLAFYWCNFKFIIDFQLFYFHPFQNQIKMKNKMKTLSCIPLMITLLLCSGRQMSGQGKVTMSVGVGLPELINIGMKYQVLDQAKIGLSIGWWPGTQYAGNLLSFSGDFYYHFAGSSKFSDLRPWFGRIGLNYDRENLTDIINWWYSYLRIGRDFYFNKKFGVSFDAGLTYHFNPETTGNSTFGAALGGCLFYRF